MRRLFGWSRPAEAAPTLEQSIERSEGRAEALGQRIRGLEQELLGYRQRMARMPAGPARSALMGRAAQLLRQKKMYEQQRDQIQQQAFNLEQVRFTTDTARESVATVAAMRESRVALQATLRQLPAGSVADLMDELEDLQEDASELQEALSRSYGMPEVDDADLELELAALDEGLLAGELDDASFLDAAVPAPADARAAADLASAHPAHVFPTVPAATAGAAADAPAVALLR
jgi:charged multivesicular body protein 5